MTAPFTAVVTTGIYCRRPALQRTTARAQHAAVRRTRPRRRPPASGRACVCRPDRLPTPDWIDAPELVCRALRLIADGALDDATEDELAARLGVSARHLRRLFVQHVGATPAEVARSSRAHFARRLLDDTDLPIAQVGTAAGFNSVRQMNRVMKEVFHFTPQELRARRRDPRPARRRRRPRAPRCPTGRRSRGTRCSGSSRPGRSRASNASTGTRACTAARSWLDGRTRGRGSVGRRPSRRCSCCACTSRDFDGLVHLVARRPAPVRPRCRPRRDRPHLARDRRLRPLVRARRGLRVPGAVDPFELGVRAILGQQVSVAACHPPRGPHRRAVRDAGPGPRGARPDAPASPRRACWPGPGSPTSGCPRPGPRPSGRSPRPTVADRRIAGPRRAGDRALRPARRRGVDRAVHRHAGGRRARRLSRRRPGAPPRPGHCRRGGTRAAAEAWRPWRAYGAMHCWCALAKGRTGCTERAMHARLTWPFTRSQWLTFALVEPIFGLRSGRGLRYR